MRIRLLLIAAFVVTLVAGSAVGLLAGRFQFSDGQKDHRAAFHEALGLTDSQKQQMEQIWGQTLRERMRQIDRDRRELAQQRDEQIDALFTEDQRTAAEAIRAEYEQQADALRTQRHEAFEQARAQTRALLTEEQQKKFDEMIAQRRSRSDGSRGDRDHWRDRRGDGPPPPEPGLDGPNVNE